MREGLRALGSRRGELTRSLSRNPLVLPCLHMVAICRRRLIIGETTNIANLVLADSLHTLNDRGDVAILHVECDWVGLRIDSL